MTNQNDPQNVTHQSIKYAQNVATGDIHNYPEHQPTETESQDKFYKLTKLWCPPEARRQFELLLSQHGFTIQELSRAIKSGYLEWDHELQQFKAKNVKLLLGFFYFIVTFFAFDFAITLIGFVNTHSVNQWPNNVLVIVNMLIYLVAMLIYGRYTIWPARPLPRLRASLSKMYRSN